MSSPGLSAHPSLERSTGKPADSHEAEQLTLHILNNFDITPGLNKMTLNGKSVDRLPEGSAVAQPAGGFGFGFLTGSTLTVPEFAPESLAEGAFEAEAEAPALTLPLVDLRLRNEAE